MHPQNRRSLVSLQHQPKKGDSPQKMSAPKPLSVGFAGCSPKKPEFKAKAPPRDAHVPDAPFALGRALGTCTARPSPRRSLKILAIGSIGREGELE